MAKWIALTSAQTNRPVWVNIDQANAIKPVESEITNIVFGSDHVVAVKETPDRVLILAQTER